MMKKEFKNKRYAKKQISKIQWRIGIAFSIIFSIAIFTYYNGYTLNFANLNPYISASKAWLTKKPTDLQRNFANAKQVIISKDTESQIHFEFYTALPNMQITPAPAIVIAKNTNQAAKKPMNFNDLEDEISKTLQQHTKNK